MLRVGLVLALILLGLLAGAVFNFAPLFLAIPIVLVALAAILVRDLRARRDRRPDAEREVERNRLGAERVEFTERDRRTLTP
jgi:membrane protein implicated in regulation of membrane protease activity